METKKSHISEYLIFFLVFALILFGFFGVLYVVQVPIFEGYDEIAHYYRIIGGDRIFRITPELDINRLALKEDDKERISELQRNLNRLYYPFNENTILSQYQLHQPPLYYDLLGLVSYGLPSGNYDIFVNPYFMDDSSNLFYNNIQGVRNSGSISKNVIFYRFISNIMMIICVMLLFLILRQGFPDKSLVVFTGIFMLFSIPQFIFTGSIINNDILLLVFSFLAIYLFHVLLNSDFKNPVAIIVLLIILPLGLFAKLSFIAIFISVISYLLIFQRTLIRKYIWWFLGLAAFFFLTVYSLDSGYLVNLSATIRMYLYNTMHTMPANIDLADFIKELFKSFYGVFGWKNIYLRRFDYIIYLLITSVFIFSFIKGFVNCIKKKEEKRDLFIFNTFIISANLLLYFFYYLFSKQPQGRFLFISIPSLIFITMTALINYRKILTAFCIFFFLWGIYINSYVTCSMLPGRYSKPAPLYLKKSENGRIFQIIPGMGFRNIENKVFYYDLSFINIYSNIQAESTRLSFTYTNLADRLNRQLLIDALCGRIYYPRIEGDSIVYNIDNLSCGRNTFYIYNGIKSDDTRIYSNKNLISINID